MPGGGWDGQVTEAELQELLRQKEKPVLLWQAALLSVILLGGWNMPLYVYGSASRALLSHAASFLALHPPAV